jgi:hypothetical protein
MLLPRCRLGAQWALELSSAEPGAEPDGAPYGARTASWRQRPHHPSDAILPS